MKKLLSLIVVGTLFLLTACGAPSQGSESGRKENEAGEMVGQTYENFSFCVPSDAVATRAEEQDDDPNDLAHAITYDFSDGGRMRMDVVVEQVSELTQDNVQDYYDGFMDNDGVSPQTDAFESVRIGDMAAYRLELMVNEEPCKLFLFYDGFQVIDMMLYGVDDTTEPLYDEIENSFECLSAPADKQGHESAIPPTPSTVSIYESDPFDLACVELGRLQRANDLVFKDIEASKGFAEVKLYFDPLFKDDLIAGQCVVEVDKIVKAYLKNEDKEEEYKLTIYDYSTGEMIDSGDAETDRASSNYADVDKKEEVKTAIESLISDSYKSGQGYFCDVLTRTDGTGYTISLQIPANLGEQESKAVMEDIEQQIAALGKREIVEVRISMLKDMQIIASDRF